MLTVDKLSVSFGGIPALSEVSMQVKQGHVHAVIGPNGAGKTTLFNLISGLYTPDAGTVFLQAQSIAGLAPEKLAQLGVSRTFQNLQICMNMTALENVMLGAHLHVNTGLLAGLLGMTRRNDVQLAQECQALMAFAGVESAREAHATQLSFGVLKRLEIARALAVKPRLLLLDEPAAGLNETETGEITALIRKIAASGVTVVLVEHDMKMVMSVSDQVVVLDQGRKIAEGTPFEVSSNPLVVAAYLGTEV